MFIDLKNYYQKLLKEHKAIGAFNTSNLEVTQAICAASAETGIPVIVQTTPGAIEHTGLNQIFDIVRNEITENKVKTALHLDHAKDFGIVKNCIDLGFPSVMIDGSALDFESNIALTKKVVKYAHEYRTVVEGELGSIGRSEGGEKISSSHKTDPKCVTEFIERTGIDSLAVSVGNDHGAPKNERIDFALLKEISEISTIPLVMHGASGLGRRDIVKAREFKVVKFNIDTQIRREFLKTLQETDAKFDDPREAMGAVRQSIKKLVIDYIKIFNL